MSNLSASDIGSGIIENLLGDVGAENDHCISCNTCRIECPANIATSLLQPRKLVRMVSLGLLEELMRLPEIWYCLQCKKCNRICPMDVKPSLLIKHIRQEAIKHSIMDWETFVKYEALGIQLQRVRWQTVTHLIQNKKISADLREWSKWAAQPIPQDHHPIQIIGMGQRPRHEQQPIFPTNLTACVTCKECTAACPIASELSVFDPLVIFRMANLGLRNELIVHPAIWLCIGCEACTTACHQSVRGHMIIQDLKELAMKENRLPHDFELQLETHQRALYKRYQLEVDSLLKGRLKNYLAFCP